MFVIGVKVKYNQSIQPMRQDLNFPTMMIAERRPGETVVKMPKDTHLSCPHCLHDIISMTGYYTTQTAYQCRQCSTLSFLMIHSTKNNVHHTCLTAIN